MLKRYSWLILLLIILGAFIVRLYRFNNPIADWHSWRQTDTSAVSIFLINDGFDVLHPRFYDISNIPSGINNPKGLRFVEFPIYNILQAGMFQIFDFFPIEQWGRLVTIAGSLASIFFLYKLARKHGNQIAAFATAFFFAFLPFSIYYGRTVLADQMTVTATLGAIYFFDIWIDKSLEKNRNKKHEYLFYILAILFTASSLLLKPFAGFFLLPIVYLAWQGFRKQMFLKWQLWMFGVLSITPIVAWRFWLSQYPEGVPASKWLFNGDNVRFKPFFFRWILYERLTKLILGFGGIILLIAGLIRWPKEKDFWFVWSFIVSSLLYVLVVARGNLQHDYYQILIIPTICLVLGRGVAFIIQSKLPKSVSIGLTGVIILSMFYFSWQNVKGYFNINNPNLILAGQKANDVLPKDALVIAPLDGDTTLLYQTKRQGWPAFQNSIEELTEMGADYLVLQTPTNADIQSFGKRYEVVASSSAYFIVKLK